MASSNAILPDKPIQIERLPDVIQDLILAYVADGIAESKSIYTAENRCSLFERGTQDKPYDKLVLHVRLHHLLRHVVSGEQLEAQAIIEAHPEFLFKSGSVNDRSGNTFVDFSPVELARFAHDADMLEMMKPYANNLMGGTEKFIAILQKANEYDEAKNEDIYDFSRLITVMNGDDEKQRTDVWAQFKREFSPRRIEVNEKSFNIKNIQKAYEIIVSHNERWSPARRKLFYSQVLELLQRLLPSCYAHALAQGIHQVIKPSQTLKRSLQQIFPVDTFLDFNGTNFIQQLDIYVKQKQQRYEVLCEAQPIVADETLPLNIQAIILEYVADDIAERQSIYAAKNRCPLFVSTIEKKTYDSLRLHEMLHRLLQHIVSSEQVKAEEIIRIHPEFLFKVGSVKHRYGNTFVSFSPVELARFTHDVEMLKMMKPYADKLPDGSNQFIAILKNANRYEDAKSQNGYDFSDLIAVAMGAFEPKRTEVMDQFRKSFVSKLIQNSEKSFNIENFRKAYEIYITHYEAWSGNECGRFWCNVIDFLMCSLPSCYAQAFSQGPYNLLETGRGLRRGFGLRKDFDLATQDDQILLGVKMSESVPAYRPWGAPIEYLCRAKIAGLRELMQPVAVLSLLNQKETASNEIIQRKTI